MDTPSNRLCVILGAGASHDVAGDGVPITNNDFRPPLAKDLFDIKSHRSYWDVLNKYNGAKVLGQELAQKSSSKTINIERDLRYYANHENEIIREHFKHIPPYLRDLISYACSLYTPAPSSYIRLVQKLLAEYQHNVLFLILNYDNLLETALKYFIPSVYKFEHIDQYIANGRQAKVVKLHGSINWFRLMLESSGEDWDSALAKFDIFRPLSEDKIVIRNGKDEVRGFRREGKFLYPILTAPLAGKYLNDTVCPKSHVDAAKDFISSCAKFLIIGTSGLDEDLLELLDTSIDPKDEVLVEIVDKSDGAEKARDRFEKGVRALHKSFQLPLSSIYNGGFHNYLASDQFIKFLKQRT